MALAVKKNKERGVLAEPYAALGRLREAQGRLPEALEAYERSLKIQAAIGSSPGRRAYEERVLALKGKTSGGRAR